MKKSNKFCLTLSLKLQLLKLFTFKFIKSFFNLKSINFSLQIFKDEILKCADEKFSSKGICNTTVAQQLRYFIIEQKANSHSSPIYIGAVLRVK